MSSGLEGVGVPDHPEQPHCATVLLLDTSGSMAEANKINQLTEGLAIFKEDVEGDPLASKRVDLAVVTFGDVVSVSSDFSTVEQFQVPALSASGSTPMGEAIMKAIDLISQRKQDYKLRGIDYYRPWIFMITDGGPTDMKPGDPFWTQVVDAVRKGEAGKQFLFFAVGVEPCDMNVLKMIAPAERPPVRLQKGKFKELFQWLSKSQSKVSASRVGDQVPLDSPKGWAAI